MKEKSLKINMALNTVKGLLRIVFPLITFPYISRVLQVSNIGAYNFCSSIVGYFILFSGLGISNYAIREGARFREDQQRADFFFQQMLSINVISTIVAYLAFAICLFCVPAFSDYKALLLVLSLQIGFGTIGVDWIYSIFEDYFYITVRTILFQIASLILMFLLVRKENDLLVYAAITVLASVGSNILNFFHSAKYCRLRLTLKIDWRKHLKPIIVIFSTSLATTIYVNLDTTLLGFMCGNYTVGIYSVSVKVYTVVKTILSSILVVSIPRLAFYLGKGEHKRFIDTAQNIFETLITFLLPSVVGILSLSKEVVWLLAGASYAAAQSSLCILYVALIVCMFAWFWGQCILLILKKEMVSLIATTVAAAANLILNLIFIPYWKENAAALTTLVSEGIAMSICMKTGYKLVKLPGLWKKTVKVLIGCFGIIAVAVFFRCLALQRIWYTILVIFCSVILYFIIELALKNEAIISFFHWKQNRSAN